MIDVTDATFETEVIERSKELPVVVDLWAPWCGPCRVLGPTIEKIVDATDGAVALAKVNVDENPKVSASFQVQSIPVVFALRDGKVVDSFVGAQPEGVIAEFVNRLAPSRSEADALVDLGDEASLREALELEPDHSGAITALALLLAHRGDYEEAQALLARIPESGDTRRVAAIVRLGPAAELVQADDAELDKRMQELLPNAKQDDSARQQILDLLEAMGSDDPRSLTYRRQLTARLF